MRGGGKVGREFDCRGLMGSLMVIRAPFFRSSGVMTAMMSRLCSKVGAGRVGGVMRRYLRSVSSRVTGGCLTDAELGMHASESAVRTFSLSEVTGALVRRAKTDRRATFRVTARA